MTEPIEGYEVCDDPACDANQIPLNPDGTRGYRHSHPKGSTWIADRAHPLSEWSSGESGGWVQTRSYDGDLNYFDTVTEAFRYAQEHPDVMKISWDEGSERVRLVRYSEAGDEWTYAPLMDAVFAAFAAAEEAATDD